MRALPFLLRYFLWLATLLLVAYLLQSRWRAEMGMPSQGDLLRESYLIHGALALGIVIVLFLLRKRAKTLIGFMFIAGSLLKFAFFFAFFYGPYIEDGHMDRGEFSAFFVPYVLSLVLEVVFTAQMLQNLEMQDRG